MSVLDESHLGNLPSGTSLLHLLRASARDEAGHNTSALNPAVAPAAGRYSVTGADGRTVNTLVRILEKISDEDWLSLHRGAVAAAVQYRYYSLNASMDVIPTAKHVFPSGGALQQLSSHLSRIKNMGVEVVKSQCQVQMGVQSIHMGNNKCISSYINFCKHPSLID